jgi:hypothetical protein
MFKSSANFKNHDNIEGEGVYTIIAKVEAVRKVAVACSPRS